MIGTYLRGHRIFMPSIPTHACNGSHGTDIKCVADSIGIQVTSQCTSELECMATIADPTTVIREKLQALHRTSTKNGKAFLQY